MLALLVPGAAWSADGGGFGLEEPTKPPPDPEKVAELTQVRSEIEVGAGYVSDDSFRFGKYNGLEEDGAYGVLNFDINGRNAWDSGDARYWNLTGKDVGLSSRELSGEYGVQGDYKIKLDYNQIPVNRCDSCSTIFDGAGTTNLTLPSPWTSGGSTANLTNLSTSLKKVDIESERKRVGIDFTKIITSNWSFTANFKNETKEGTGTIGAVIGNSGGNPRAVILPMPIDYETQQLEAILRYSDRKMQFQAGYYMSLFNDNNVALKWQNPFAGVSGWDASASYPNGYGQLALPPDNQFHQVSLMGGYNFSDTTRLTADVALGRMTQDEPFLPYTVNPTLAASITQPLPRASLDGQIDTTLINIRLHSRPTREFFWNAAIRYDERDNKTPRDEYVYIGGDSQTQDTSATSSRRRYNEPYSYKQELYKLDGGYKIAKQTNLTAGIDHSKTERTYSEREEADETTYKVGLKTAFNSMVTGAVRLSRADRDGSTYVGEEPFLSGYDPGYTSTVDGGWENHPDMRKYNIADRIRDKATAIVTLMPAEQWSIGLHANVMRDDYKSSEIGLTDSRITSYTADVTFLPMTSTSIYAFFSVEDMKYNQDGHAFSGGANKLPHFADPERDWWASHRDQVDTVGLGFKHELIKNRLDVGADYVRSDSEGKVNVTTGTSLTSEPLPVSKTKLDAIGVYAKYKLMKNWSVKVRYWHEKYKSNDWAFDGVDPDTLANVIGMGETSPDYKVNVYAVSVAYRF